MKEVRKKRRKNNQRLLKILIAVLALILVFNMIFIFQRNKLKGKWKFDEITSYRFDADRTGALVLPDAQYAFTYQFKHSVVMIDYVDEDITDGIYRFERKGNTLVLTSEDGSDGTSFTFTKEK